MLDETGIFMAIIFFVGLYLFIVSSKIDSDLDNCKLDTAKNMRRANKGLVVISVIFMSVSLSFLYQKLNSCTCPSMAGTMSVFTTKEAYITLFLLLGIVLIGLSSTIKSNEGNICVLNNSSGLLNFTIFIGVMMMLGCGGYLGMSIYNNQRVGIIPESRM